MVSVYAKRNMKKNEMVGWFSLGLNSSGPEEMSHWLDMRKTTRGELLARWHVLGIYYYNLFVHFNHFSSINKFYWHVSVDS